MDFERKTIKLGGSVAIVIPPDVCKYLGIEEAQVMDNSQLIQKFAEVEQGMNRLLGEYLSNPISYHYSYHCSSSKILQASYWSLYELLPKALLPVF